jgi:glycosyltransferase involved in cell wall biosynthesis
MCHNRPKTATEAIESIINQSTNDFIFIISDNSTNNDLYDIVKKKFPTVKYMRHSKVLISLFAHFTKLLSVVTTQYVALLHDDDMVHPNFVKAVLQQISHTPNIAAIGVNGSCIDVNSKDLPGLHFIPEKNGLKTFEKPIQMINQYLTFENGGGAAFCAYVYNMNLIYNLKLDYSRGRYYCDTVFLLDVLERGRIVWLNEPLVKVRIHDEHITANCGVRDYKSFISIIEMDFEGLYKQNHLDEYHIKRLYFTLKTKSKWPVPAVKFLLIKGIKLLFISKIFRRKVLTYMIANFYKSIARFK